MKTNGSFETIPTPRTLPEFLARSADLHADRVALRWANREGETFTYEGLHREVEELALGLLELGAVRDERVGVFSENRPRWAACYFSIHRAGAIAVPIDALLKEREVGEIGRAAELRYVFASARMEPIVRAALPRVRVISLDDSREAFLTYEAMRARGRASSRRQQLLERTVSPERLAVLIFTSGTTGSPKAVALSHRNLAANVNSVLAGFDVNDRDRLLSVLPLHHTFECTMGLLMPVAAGATVVYARSLKSKELMEDLRDSQATLMLGVPLLYRKMLEGLEGALAKGNWLRRGVFLPLLRALRALRAPVGVGRALMAPLRAKAGMGGLRFFVSGAAALQSEVYYGFRALGIEMLQGYGLTETSPVLTVNPPHKARTGSVGPPIRGVELRIDRPGPDGVGEVLARGENVMEMYYGDPRRTREVMEGDFFRTGDLGRLDSDGYLYLCGRSKSMIATGAGKKIYPEEVETALTSSHYIAEALVYGRRERKTSHEDVCAILLPDWERLQHHLAQHGQDTSDETAVRAFLKAEVARVCNTLADYKRVRDFTVRREEFPRTTTGKVKRFLFVDGEQLDERQEAAARAPEDRTAVRAGRPA